MHKEDLCRRLSSGASAGLWDRGGAISLVNSLLLSCLEHEFYPCLSLFVLVFTKVVSHPLFSEHDCPPSTKRKHSYECRRGAFKSWWQSIQACLMQMLLWSLEWPPAPHWCLGVTPQSPGAYIGSVAAHCTTTDFLHPLVLPAECLSVSDGDLTSRMRVTLSLGFPGHEQEPVTTCHLLGPGANDQVVLNGASHFQGGLMASCQFYYVEDILLGLHPECKNFKPGEGGTSAKDYNCLAEGCSMQSTNKESAHNLIWVALSHTGIFLNLDRPDGCHPWCEPFQNWEAFWKHLASIHGMALTHCMDWRIQMWNRAAFPIRHEHTYVHRV